jgi:hypothetical protein
MIATAGLFAAAALQAQSPAAQAADTFVQACLGAKGERAAVRDLARTRQWEAAQPGALPEGVAWMDGYSTPAGYLGVFESARRESAPAVSSDGHPLPTVIRLAQDQCFVALPAGSGWQEVATLLDASDALTAFPQDLQPQGPSGPEGIARRYALAETKPDGSAVGLVTVVEAEHGLVIQATRTQDRND